jgi:hypothetical protein
VYLRTGRCFGTGNTRINDVDSLIGTGTKTRAGQDVSNILGLYPVKRLRYRNSNHHRSDWSSYSPTIFRGDVDDHRVFPLASVSQCYRRAQKNKYQNRVSHFEGHISRSLSNTSASRLAIDSFSLRTCRISSSGSASLFSTVALSAEKASAFSKELWMAWLAKVELATNGFTGTPFATRLELFRALLVLVVAVVGFCRTSGPVGPPVPSAPLWGNTNSGVQVGRWSFAD